MHKYVYHFIFNSNFPDSSRYVPDPAHSNPVIQTPTVHMVRNPQRIAPSPRGPATPKATSMTMSWFWTTTESDKDFSAQSDEGNPPAVMNQEPITRDKNSAGKYMYLRGVNFTGFYFSYLIIFDY
mgnify:FL=1